MLLKPPGRGTAPTRSRSSSTRSRGRGRGGSGTGSTSASEDESMTGIETSHSTRGTGRGTPRGGTTPRGASSIRGAPRGGAPFRGAKSVRFTNGVATSSSGPSPGPGAANGNATNAEPGHGPQAGGFSAPIERQKGPAQSSGFGGSTNTGFEISNGFRGSGLGTGQSSQPANPTMWSNDQVPAGFGMSNNNTSTSSTATASSFGTGFGGSGFGQNSNNTGFGSASSGFGSDTSNGFGSAFGSSDSNGFGTGNTTASAPAAKPLEKDGANTIVNGITGKQRAASSFSRGQGRSVDFAPSPSRQTSATVDQPAFSNAQTFSQNIHSPTPAQGQARSQRFSQGGNYHDRYQALKKSREQERVDAIANGFLADPNRPRSLADAITPVGTCQDMCAEFERLERIVQNDVWEAEKDQSRVDASNKAQPDETRMVKKFRRAAAGLDEQLPSDLRPPAVLQRTCDYLFSTLLSDFPSLVRYHHFIWDRTRAIRNDFSIQQLSKAADVRIGIDCYERIARFHILSLHLFSYDSKPYERYDAQQEREQLDKTLLSLMQYYDDSRGRVQSPNEAEFRAYCIIFQIQDPVPDLEDRVQTWPRGIITDPRVTAALDIYAAACNTNDPEGPMRPKSAHPIAQANWARFWSLVKSKRVSYLTSCVAEMYFALVRQTAMQSIWIAYRSSGKKKEDWTISDLAPALGFDGVEEAEEATVSFLESYGFAIGETSEGQQYVDLSSLGGRQLPDPSRGMWRQGFNWMFEWKRAGRSLSALILGMSVKRAREKGMVGEETVRDEQPGTQQNKSEGLFWTAADDKPKEQQQHQSTPSFQTSAPQQQHTAQKSEPPRAPFSFGSTPSTTPPATTSKPLFSFGAQQPVSSEQQQLPSTQPSSNPFQLQPNASPFQPSQKPAQTHSFAPAASSSPFSQSPSTNTNPFSPQPSKPEPPKSDNSNPFATLSSPTSQPPTSSFPKQDDQKASEALPSSPATSFAAPVAQTQSTPEASRKPSFSSYKNPFAPSKPSPLGKQPPFAPQSADPSPPLPSAAPVSQQSVGGSFTFTPQQAPAASAASSPSIFSQPQQPSQAPGPSSAELDSQRKRKEAEEAAEVEKRNSDTLYQLSRELVVGPYGFFEQYFEFTAPSVIRQVREKVQLRKDTKFADEFRLRKIMQRYGLKWRDICWKKRLQTQGKARRQRMRAHREEQERRSRDNSVSATLEGFKASTNGRSASREQRPEEEEQPARAMKARKTVEQDAPQADAFGNSTISIPPASPEQRQSPARRPLSLIKTTSTGHRRSESAPDNSFVSSLTGLRSVRENPGLRSSRLRHSFRPEEQTTSRVNAVSNHVSFDTTRSTYFKLKAMGINPNASGNKRPRSDSDGSLRGRPDKRSQRHHSPASAQTSRNHSPAQAQPITPANASPTRQPHQAKQSPLNEEDEELFASVRQIRDAMNDSITFFQSSVQREEGLQHSRSSHGGAGSPPGMNASISSTKPDGKRDWRAYAEQKLAASMRQSQAEASVSSGKRQEPPPAHRNRVSKFLSREKYADLLSQKRRDIGQGQKEKYTPLRYRKVERPVQEREERAEEEDTSMVDEGVDQQGNHVQQQQEHSVEQQQEDAVQEQQPSFMGYETQQAASKPAEQEQQLYSHPASQSQQPWGSIDPALFGSSFGPETTKPAPATQEPASSQRAQTPNQPPQETSQIIDLASSPPPLEQSERQMSQPRQSPSKAPEVEVNDRPQTRDSIVTPEASFSYAPQASQWPVDLGSSSFGPETNVEPPHADSKNADDAATAPMERNPEKVFQPLRSSFASPSRPLGFGSGMGLGPGGFGFGQTSFASTGFGDLGSSFTQQQQPNEQPPSFGGMGFVEETHRVEESFPAPQQEVPQEPEEPVTQIKTTTIVEESQVPMLALDEGGDTEPEPSRPASPANDDQAEPRATTERPSPPPLKRQRNSPEDSRINVKSRPNKARKQEKAQRNISANRFDLLAGLGDEADGATDDDNKSVSSTAESLASQPPARRSRSPQKQQPQQPVAVSSDATIDPNDEQYQQQHANNRDLNDGYLASQMQSHLDPQARQAQRVLDRLSPAAMDRHPSRSRSVTPSRHAKDVHNREQSEEAPAFGEDIDDAQDQQEPNGFHVREHSAASTTSVSGSASSSESRDPGDGVEYAEDGDDVEGDTEPDSVDAEDYHSDTAPSQPRGGDVGFDDGLEYANDEDEGDEDRYRDEEDFDDDDLADDEDGLEEMEEDESDLDVEDEEDDQPTPKAARRPQPKKEVLINGKSGASAEDAIEL